MEAILFYGDQDEATRRQVRSVAAQYSHRIGPRKRKKSKVPKQAGVTESKRGQYKKLATPASEVDGASSKTKPGQQRFKVVFDQQQSHVEAQVKPDAIGSPGGQQQHVQREDVLRREFSDSETCAGSSEVGSEPTHSPHTPQLGFLPCAGRARSPEKPQSTYRRLPAYTWTEYPRYAVIQVSSPTPSDIMPNIAAANRPAFELPSPTACIRGLELSGHTKQNPPRSHPLNMPVEPQHSHADSHDTDPFLVWTLNRTSMHEAAKESVPLSQPVSQPPLQILRCAPAEDGAPGDGVSRWRSDSEYFTAEEQRLPNSPG